jgi:long-chain acyl-CoA synthetase
MSEYKNLVEMQQASVTKYSDNKLFGTKKNGTWNWITFKEFGEMVDHCRGGLAAQGIGKGDSVAVISGNRVEWAVIAYATYGLGARLVPMYEHQLAEDWKYIIEDSGTKLLVVSLKDIFEQVKGWKGEMASLEAVFCMEFGEEDPQSYAKLLSAGKNNPTDTIEIDPELICGFIYTSGTTGNPKGVLLSHSNFISNVNAIDILFDFSPRDRCVSFLPWAHSFGQTCELHVLLNSGSGVAFAESIDKLVDNFSEVHPTILVSVPRIFNKIYAGLRAKMDEAGGLKKFLFYAAMENATKRRHLEEAGKSSALVNFKHWLFDRIVFSKVRDRFGGCLRYAFSGGAALSPEVAEFIDNLGIIVYEGYGLTETSPIACCNYIGHRKIGSVGKALLEVEVKIDTSVVEDDSDDGEIVVYGPNVMKGYHNLPEETAKVMTEDGGFRTGDRGRMDEEGYVYVTGRIKEQYKLENGKYVVPAPLEEQLQLSPYIMQAYIDGANRLYNVALIYPEQEAIARWAKEQGLGGEYKEIIDNPKTKEMVKSEIDQFSKGFKGYERVKQFAFMNEEMSTQNGLLTPSLKVKRRKVIETYEEVLDKLWTTGAR